MAANPSAVHRGDPIAAAETGSRVAPTETLDLATANALTRAFPVAGLTRVSARINPSAWGTAVVEMKRSIDGANPTAYLPRVTFNSIRPEQFARDTGGAAFVIFETITADAAADSKARVDTYAYRPNA